MYTICRERERDCDFARLDAPRLERSSRFLALLLECHLSELLALSRLSHAAPRRI